MNIEIRQEKVWLVKNGKPGFSFSSSSSSCAECGGQMLTIDEAAQNTDFGSRAIFQMVEAGEIHFQENAKGLLLICAATLAAQRRNKND